MFCTIATTIERCKTEGMVDVFQVVKALRVQKPAAVRTVVSMPFPACDVCYFNHVLVLKCLIPQPQYQLIFEALLVFLDSFSTHANFLAHNQSIRSN